MLHSENNESGMVGTPQTLMLLGASPASTNRGVAALGTACVDNLCTAYRPTRLIIGAGGLSEKMDVQFSDRNVSVETTWLSGSPRLIQRSGAPQLRWLRRISRWAPGLGNTWLANRTYQQLDACDAVLDIAGGDSFADIYGGRGLKLQAAVKRLAFAFDKPLVLLPQTIGPFRDRSSQFNARDILSRSALVATREAGGLRELERLLGSDLDDRFVACPDVAFTLRPKPPNINQGPWTNSDDRTIIGLNVSGLLWRSNVDFGLTMNYQALIHQLIDWVMKQRDTRLLLVPHVFNSRRSAKDIARRRAGLTEDSDLAVSLELRNELKKLWGDRVESIEQPYEAAELKWIIGHCDFFIGARMHACIAAVSQAVPSVTLAYSKKAAGVMGMLAPAQPVIDLRREDATGVVTRIDREYQERAEMQDGLISAVSKAKSQVHEFFQSRLPQTLGMSRSERSFVRSI